MLKQSIEEHMQEMMSTVLTEAHVQEMMSTVLTEEYYARDDEYSTN